MRIDLAGPDHPRLHELAELHASELSAGLLPLLGPRFLSALYRYAARDSASVLVVAEDDGRVAGFVMGSASPGWFYAGLLARTWPLIALALVRRPAAISRALSLGRHVYRPPGAELLSIVVRPEYRGTGLAAQLLEEFERLMAGIYGVTRFSVTAADTQPAALRFYRKTGGVVVEEAKLGGLRTLTFVYENGVHGASRIAQPSRQNT